MRLLTNNPKKVVGLNAYGLEITERVPIEITSNPSNEIYLQTKKDKLGHLLLINSRELTNRNTKKRKKIN